MNNEIKLECPECKQTFTISADYKNLYININIDCPNCGKTNSGQYFRLVLEGKTETTKVYPEKKPCKTGLTVLENYIDEADTLGPTGDFYEICKRSVSVGRKSASSTADIQIPSNRYMSRRHILLTNEDDRYYLEWIANTNPPVINGNEMSKETRIEIKDGDEIKLGQCTMRMSIAPSEEKSIILSL